MGSGAVMSAGIAAADRYRATVAVSPTGADVSPESPRNLLLMAGTLEPQFAANGRDLLARAGGANDDLAGGRGRAMVDVPNVEHITILFSRTAHQAALDWLNRTFDLPPTTAAADRRVVWYVAHLAGWLLLLAAAAPLIPPAAPAGARRHSPWPWLGLPLGALAAVLLLALLGRVGDVSRLGGLLVGGALALWFAALGLVWLRLGFRPPRPTGRDALWGLLLFAALTLAFGVMADRVWLPWWLTPARLLRWLPAAAAALPWLLAAGVAQQGDAGRVDLRLGQQGGVGGVEVALQAAVVETGAGRAVAVKVEQHDAVAGAGQWLAEAEHERRRTREAVGNDDRRNASRARWDEEQQRLAIGPAQAPALQPARPRQHAPPGQPNEQQGGGDQGETKGAKTGEQMGATRQR